MIPSYHLNLSSVWDGLKLNYSANHTNDTIVSFGTQFAIESSTFTVIDLIQNLIKEQYQTHARYYGIHADDYIIELPNQQGMIRVRDDTGSGKPDKVRMGCFNIAVYGLIDPCKKLKEKIWEVFSNVHLPRVTWWFMSDGGIETRDIVLQNVYDVKDEFYPWIEGGVHNFFEKFRESDASILFMLGTAGTGKTSLIRSYLDRYKENAVVTYEDSLLNRDTLYVSFLAGTRANVLVIEDADMMLGSREHAGNKLMAKFLNISDGLVKFKNKKMIFTTNLEDFSNIDPALLREGRCFGALTFRPLTHREAVKAAEAAGLPIPDDEGDMTLAKLFHQKREHTIIKRKVGF